MKPQTPRNACKKYQKMAWLVQIHRFYRDSHNMHASWVCGSVRLQRQVYDPAELAWIDTFSEGISNGGWAKEATNPYKSLQIPKHEIIRKAFENWWGGSGSGDDDGDVDGADGDFDRTHCLALGCIKLAKSPLVVLVLGWFGLVTGHSTDTIVEHSWVGFCPSLIFQYPNVLYCVFSTHSSTGSKD